MSETYTVERAEHKANKPDKGYGPMQVIVLALKDQQGETHVAEWYTKASTPVPQPGVSLTGDVNPGQYGLTFKRAQQFPSGSGGGPRPEDPKRAKRILRQHSQDMAMRAIALAIENGLLMPNEGGGFPQNTADLFVLIAKTADWFDKDAEAAGERA